MSCSMLRPYCISLGRKGMGGGGAVLPSLGIDFTTAVSPTRAIPYGTGETYKFTRASTVWCPSYDTATQALKWVEIPADVPPMPGMRWDAVNSLWSPYDDNGLLIPTSIRKGYWYLPQQTNSIAYSRDFTNAYWTQSNITVAKDAVGFDGVGNNGCTLTDSSTTLTGLIQKNITVTADDAVNAAIYIVAKDQDESRFPGFFLSYAGGSTRLFSVHLNTKTGASAAGYNSDPTTNSWKVIDGGDSWVVALYSQNVASYNNTVLIIRADPADAKILGNNDVSATGSIVLQNVDLRLNTTFYDGSPIVTNGSALTRLAGDYRISINNHSQSAGMVLCEVEAPLPSSTLLASDSSILSLSANAYSVLYNKLADIKNYDGTTGSVLSLTSWNKGDTLKLGIRWSGAEKQLVVNGAAGTEDTYDGAFTVSGSDAKLFYLQSSPWYLKYLKYYQSDKGTAWIQGQQS